MNSFVQINKYVMNIMKQYCIFEANTHIVRENKSNAIISSHFFLSHLLDLINSPHFPSCNAGLLSAAFHIPVKCAMLLVL